jgi:ankyrin repeat protein
MSSIKPTDSTSPGQEPSRQGGSAEKSQAGRIQEVAQSVFGGIQSHVKPPSSIAEIRYNALSKPNLSDQDFAEELCLAARHGELDNVQQLLANRDTIHERVRGSAVLCATEDGHHEVVQVLLKDDAKISEKDRDRAVRAAARSGRTDIIEALLKNGKISGDGRSEAVHAAAERGHFGVVHQLLTNGPIDDKYRGVVIIMAAIAGRLDIIQELLKNDAKISEKDRGEAVIEAAEKGHLKVVQELLARGQIDNKKRGIAVYKAAGGGHLKVVQELLDIEQIDDFIKKACQSAIIFAARGGHLNVVQELLRIGPIGEDFRGKAVYKAAKGGHLNVIQELLRIGPIGEDFRGLAVCKAARGGHLNVIQELLRSGPIDDDTRATAVSEAATGGHTQVIQVLMRGPENSFIFLNHPQIDVAILRTSGSGNAEVLEALLANIPSITSNLRESAITQARNYLNDSDRLIILDLLSLVNINDHVQGAQEPRFARDSLVVPDWENVKDNPLRFLEAAVKCQFQRIAFGRGVVVDLGGVSKQFLSTLTQALQDKKLLEIDDYTRLPRLSQGESLRPQQVDTLKYLGALISHLDRRNEGRTDKFMIGPIFHEEFFNYFRSEPHPFRAFFIDGNLKDSDVESKYNESRIFDEDETYDQWKLSIQGAMSCIRERFTPEFQRKIEVNPNLGRELLGQKLTAESILGSLKIQEGLNSDMVRWLQNWITSTTDEKRQEFVFGITGNKFLSPTGILINQGWREPANFETHTCSNSLDLPDTTKSSELDWNNEANFMYELNQLFKPKGYNIA